MYSVASSKVRGGKVKFKDLAVLASDNMLLIVV